MLGIRVGHERQRLARRAQSRGVSGARAEDLDLERRLTLVPLGDDEIEVAEEAAGDLVERQLRGEPAGTTSTTTLCSYSACRALMACSSVPHAFAGAAAGA